MDKIQFVKLCSRSWSIKSLALIARGCSPRVSPLSNAAGCGRTAMTASIQNLAELGLLERNPGYGHPLRPEFRLTDPGVALAKWALWLDNHAHTESDQSLIRSKWGLPVMSCINSTTRFSHLRNELVPVTDRALSICLTNLTSANWISRRVSQENFPPLVHYDVANPGHPVRESLKFVA